jgi:hypothetical protein
MITDNTNEVVLSPKLLEPTSSKHEPSILSQSATRAESQQPLANDDFEILEAAIERIEPLSETVVMGHPIYTVHTRKDDSQNVVKTRGAAAMPPGTSYLFQSALQKWNLCDVATYSMLPYITPVVQKYHARADWLVIDNVVPRITLVYPGQKVEAIQHSVCLITSATGKQYIADFTIEQFGYDGSMWFTKRSDYHRLVCSGYGGLSADDEWYEWMDGLTDDGSDQTFLYKACQAARKACGMVGTKPFERLKGQERIDWMRDRAAEAVMSYDR